MENLIWRSPISLFIWAQTFLELRSAAYVHKIYSRDESEIWESGFTFAEIRLPTWIFKSEWKTKLHKLNLFDLRKLLIVRRSGSKSSFPHKWNAQSVCYQRSQILCLTTDVSKFNYLECSYLVIWYYYNVVGVYMNDATALQYKISHLQVGLWVPT